MICPCGGRANYPRGGVHREDCPKAAPHWAAKYQNDEPTDAEWRAALRKATGMDKVAKKPAPRRGSWAADLFRSLYARLKRSISPAVVRATKDDPVKAGEVRTEEVEPRTTDEYKAQVLRMVRREIDARPEPEGRKRGITELHGTQWTPPTVVEPTDDEMSAALKDAPKRR